MRSVDLHLHTYYSDGTNAPEELVLRAVREGFTGIAVTDHDTVEGCPRAALACAQAGIRFLPGTELTAELGGDEVHLLAYGIALDHPRLLQEMAIFQQVRCDRIREMVARLNRLDIPLRADTVFELANCRSPGRPHVGRALVAEGFCSGVDEAFERFLKKHRPAWVPKRKISAAEGIGLVHEAGGLAIMAHPGLNRSDGVIPMVVEAGLDGLECYHSKHTAGMAEHYLRLARKYNLLITGGSDCHGWSRGNPVMGSVRLPVHYLDLLEDRLRLRDRPNLPKSQPTVSSALPTAS